MHLIPTNEEVIAMLRETGALREGHFEYPNGTHTDEYLQVALAFRYYQFAKVLSVGLSRRLRADPEIRAMIKELSIVCPTIGGLPIAFGVCEALRAHQVYWAEPDTELTPMHFRQFVEPARGEKILMVDDILRSGRRLTLLRALAEEKGAEVVGVAVAVYQPNPDIADLGNLPLFYLAKMSALYYKDTSSCELCHRGVPVQKVWT
ncbi:MAG TPA: phosphoribosyltransferase family protein [Bryobacteraceae bacterium]|jgi:orotate phosphoribosyltransferase